MLAAARIQKLKNLENQEKEINKLNFFSLNI
jgi:hypothetical protein